MPNLKYPELFQLNASDAFDLEHPAGAPAPYNGIYRCTCGHEVVAVERTPLSAEPHARHPAATPLRWRLVAAARRNELDTAPQVATNFSSPPGWPPRSS